VFFRKALSFLGANFLLLLSLPLLAAGGGSISGIVLDKNGAAVSGAMLTLVNKGQQATYHVVSNGQGLYSFPTLPVGHYDLKTDAQGFASQRNKDLVVDTDSVVRLEVTLDIRANAETVTVSGDTASMQVETAATHLGEVVSAAEMTALPLNGRSYTSPRYPAWCSANFDASAKLRDYGRSHWKHQSVWRR
jgi:Carboxypeptidase regulatory-like domain